MESAIVPVAAEAVVPGGSASQLIEAPYGASLAADASAFGQSLDRATAAAAAGNSEVSAVAEALFEPLERINHEADELAQYAQDALSSDGELTPSEIMMLTVRSQEFMFHAQLTANVANRTADGMQQLFRQQG